MTTINSVAGWSGNESQKKDEGLHGGSKKGNWTVTTSAFIQPVPGIWRLAVPVSCEYFFLSPEGGDFHFLVV